MSWAARSVVPYVGTWIKISGAKVLGVTATGRSLRGNVDRNMDILIKNHATRRRSLRGNVDRNLHSRIVRPLGLCRSLRGNVDRNRSDRIQRYLRQGRSLRGNVDRNSYQCDGWSSIRQVVPYVGTWIEIRTRPSPLCPSPVVPYVGTWIEIHCAVKETERTRSRSLRGNADRNVPVREISCSAHCRSLRGNVDRNGYGSCRGDGEPCRSLHGNADRNGIGKVLSGKIICSNW